MVSEKISIKFTNFKSYNDKELLEISPEDAVSICSCALNQKETTGEEILKYWSNKLLRVYGLCSNQILQELFKIISNYFESIVTKQNVDETAAIQCIMKYLDEWYNILKWIEETLKEFQLKSIELFFDQIIKCLDHTFTFAFKRISKENIQIILQKCVTLEDKVLNIIFDNPQLFICDKKCNVDTIINLIKVQCNMLKYVSKLDFKTAINAWKVILKLSIENSKYLIDNSINDSAWLEGIVTAICEEIKQSILVLYDNKVEIPLPKFERILKVCSFYVKNLLRIAGAYKHTDFQGSHQVLETMFMLLKVPNRFKQSNKHDLVSQYLIVGVMQLLPLIYKNTKFCQELLENETYYAQDQTIPFTDICIEIMTILCDNTDTKIVDFYINHGILEKTINKVEICHRRFVGNTGRLKIVGASASLFMLKHKQPEVITTFIKLLIQGISQYDIGFGKICIDIWLTIARFLKADERYKYFKLWNKLNDEVPKYSTELRTLFLYTLVRVFYQLLPEAYKSAIWKEYFENPSKASRLLLTVGVFNIRDDTRKLMYQKKLEDELSQIAITKNELTILENYYKLVELLKLLSTAKIKTGSLGLHLSNLWSVISIDTFQKHHIILTALIECSHGNMPVLTEDQLQDIVDKIEDYLKDNLHDSTSFKELVRGLLHRLVIKYEILSKEISDKNKNTKVIPKNTIFAMPMKRPGDFCKPASAGPAGLINNSEHNIAGKRKHIAMGIDDKQVVSQDKRIKLHTKYGTVENALKTANDIQHFFHNKIPCNTDLEDMKKIIQIYHDIINKK